MNPPTEPGPDFPPEWLAAYADGELDAQSRAAVERWLADHPDARGELDAQRAFSPANAGLWERAEPPEPSVAAWAAARRQIEGGLNPPVPATPGRWRVAGWVLGGLAAGVAAAVAWVAFGPVAPPAPGLRPVEVVKVPPGVRPPAGPEVAPAPREVVRSVRPDPLDGFAVLPMAADNDVVLERVPDTRAGWLPVGRHPLPDVLVLASLEELDLLVVDPSPAWPTGGPKMTTGPRDAPMIFAAKPR